MPMVGRALVVNGVTSDGSKVTACTVCHRGDLRGLGSGTNACGTIAELPRELYDMQRGNRPRLWLLSLPISVRTKTIC